MTKFGMSRKPDYSVSYSGLSSFDSFQNRNRIGATLEDLKIQEVLRHGEILKGAKEPRWRKSIPKAEVTKTVLFNFGYRSIWFSQNR
jgi:hypothetical protein